MDIDENQSFQPDADESLENDIVTNITANKNYLSMNFFKPKTSSNPTAMPSFNLQSSSKPVSRDSSASVHLNQKYEFNPSRTSS